MPTDLPTAASSPAAAPLSILIVEDEGIIAKDLKRRLERHGYSVAGIASNGPDALALVSQTQPSLVLMDIVLQGPMDGIATAREIIALVDVPVVFLTAHSDAATVERAKAAMPYGYLIKPFEERELTTCIEMALYRSQAEHRLLEQARLINEARDAIITCSMDWRITSWNRGAERLYGWSSAEVTGTTLIGLLQYEAVIDSAEAEALLRTSSEWRGELDQTTRTGRQIVVQSHQSLVKDLAGNPKAILLINSDITEKKIAEDQVKRSQRLESIGTLASGLAHDLNNALAPLMIGLGILRTQCKDFEALQMLELMEVGASRGADIIRQLMRFAAGSEGEKSLIEIPRILEQVLRVAKLSFGENIAIESSVDEGLWPVLGNSTEIHQVLLNLCLNARDAIIDRGRLSVCARKVYIDENYAASVPNAKPGPYTCLEVRDTGHGIAPEDVDKIFEPFFSTKTPDKGTGLGLFNVYSIVHGHDGFIHLETKPGSGTCFKVYFPALIGTSAPAAPAAANPDSFHGNGQTILLVDSDPVFRETAQRVIESLGFLVLTAADGAEGLMTFTLHRQEIKVVITDIRMRRLNGIQMAAALREKYPALGLIISSGCPPERWEEQELRSLNVHSILAKPFPISDLIGALRSVLERQESAGNAPGA